MEAPMMWPGRMQGVTERPTSPGGGGDTHTVRDGDTLGDIAHQYGTSTDALRSINPQIRDGGRLAVGDSVNLPMGTGNTSSPGHNGNPMGMPGGQAYATPTPPTTASMPTGLLPPLVDGLLPRALPPLPSGSMIPTTWPSSLPSATPMPMPHDNPGMSASHGNDVLPVDIPHFNDSANVPPPIANNPGEPPPPLRYDEPPQSTLPSPTNAQPDVRATPLNTAPTSPTNTQATTTPGATNTPSSVPNAATVVIDKAQILLARGDAGTAPRTSLPFAASTATVVLAQTVPQRADVPVLARSLAENALLGAMPGKETAQTSTTPRDAPKLTDAQHAQTQTPNGAENAARDPAKLLRDVQARMLSDARPAAETQQRNPASTDPLFKRSDKAIANAPATLATEEPVKTRGSGDAERDPRLAARRSGESLWMLDWVGQLAKLRRAHRQDRIDEAPDLLATAAAIGVGVTLLAGVFALYALYKYWVPH